MLYNTQLEVANTNKAVTFVSTPYKNRDTHIFLTKFLHIMKTISETGHAKNVANFETLTSIVASVGANYNPSKTSIQLTALYTVSQAAKEALLNVNQTESVYKLSVNERIQAFADLSKKTTAIFNLLKASDSSIQSDESVKTIYRKLQGRRAGTKLTDEEIAALKAEGKEVTQNSVSQMSFDNRLANLARFITMLSNIPAYNPNEEIYKIAALQEYLNILSAKNSVVTTTYMAWDNARTVRDQVLYSSLSGIIDLAADVKSYVKGIFGTDSSIYQKLVALKFRSY